jgi:hypothetical protein
MNDLYFTSALIFNYHDGYIIIDNLFRYAYELSEIEILQIDIFVSNPSNYFIGVSVLK